MKYGTLPTLIGECQIFCKEMMFYQYLPIKLKGELHLMYEPRLLCFRDLILKVKRDYIDTFGNDEYNNSYIYLTAKYLYQTKNNSYNRFGWHSDGFLTDDINYIWSDKFPTIFNTSDFNLTLDDSISMKEMEQQAKEENNVVFKNNQILRLDQYNIHKVAPVTEEGMRTFVKVSFSKDQYNLIGNSHNYLLDYNWKMVERKKERNTPQVKL